MIEEGFFNNSVSREVIDTYLRSPELEGIEALVLACTHYPLIRPAIEAYYQGAIPVVDSAEHVARALKEGLQGDNLLNAGEPHGNHRFFVSDLTASFEASSRLFFGEQVHLDLYPLWG